MSDTAPAKTFNHEDSKCGICQEEYDSGEEPEIPLTLSCGHVLGSVCLSRWLHVPDRRHGCPMCRRMLFRVREESDDEVEEGEIEGEDEDGEERMSLDNDPTNEPQSLHEFTSYAQLADHLAESTSEPLESLEDELSTEMRRLFGHYRSTETVIAMLRSPLNSRPFSLAVIDSMLRDRRQHHGNAGVRQSYRAETTHLYNEISVALTRAFNWLHTRPAFNLHACRALGWAWGHSLRETVASFRASDRATLIHLIKSGIFAAPRMEAPFDLRLMMVEHVSVDTVPFGEAENRVAGAEMYRVLRAMPNLTAAYEDIAVMERRDPLQIAEYNFQVLWERDMGILPEVPLGSGQQVRVGNTLYMGLPPPTISSDAGVSEPGALMQSDRLGNHRPSRSSMEMSLVRDMESLSQAVNRTLAAANSLLGSYPGSAGFSSESSQTADSQESTTAEDGAEWISRRIDRTLAAANELVRSMNAPQTAQHEASGAHAETEPRQLRGGRRGRGRRRGSDGQ